MKVFAGCLVVMMATRLVAQNPAQLSFEEAVKIGLERNVLLKQQKNQLEFNQVQKMAGYANFLPNVNLTSTLQRQAGQQPNTTTGNLEDLQTTFFNAQLNGNLNVFNGLRGVNTLGQASNQLMAQSYLVKRSTQDVVNSVAVQYLQVLLDQELLKIAEENLKSQNTLLAQMQGFYEVGTRAITDVYSQDALMKAAQVSFIRARNTLQNDKSILAQTLQLDPSQNFEVVYPELKVDVENLSAASLDSLVDVAIANRADLEQLRYQVKANQFQYKTLSSGFLPSLSLFANYGSFYYSEIPLSFGEQFRNFNPSFSYGANLTVPIFSRFANKTQRMNAQVQFKNTELNRQNLEKTVKLDVQRALTNLINAKENLAASQSQFQSGELALRTQQESYELGISAQVVLAQAMQIYVQGAAAKAQAEVTLIFQRVLLDYSLGILKAEDLIGQ
jgi:outer membrane protein